MNFLSKLTALAAVLFSFGVSAEGISFQHISLDEAVKKAKVENKPIFIDVYATWCGPCKYLSREVFVEDELGAYMNANFINLKLDGEEGDGDYLMAEFGLDAFPTMLFLSPNQEELNRIVGALSAEEILDISKGVIDPTSTKIYQLRSRYDKGDRDKEFMQSYISELVEVDEDFEPIVAEYIDLYPDLDLYSEGEFLIFCIGVNDLDDPKNQTFIENINDYNVDFPDLTQAKMSILIYSLCEEAFTSGDYTIIDKAVDQLTEPLNQILDEEVTEDDLREIMLESIAEM
jgi:thioredoxin-related protein